MTKLMMAAAAAVLLAAPVQAQSHEHGAATPAAAEKHECPMHAAGADHGNDAAHRYAPKMILKHADMLKLSADQKQALEQLQAGHKQECEQHMAETKQAEEAAAQLLAEPVIDLQKYEAKLHEAAGLKVKCKVSMVALGQQAKALLSAEQLAHLSHMSHAGHQ